MKLPSFNFSLPREIEPVGLARYLDTFFTNIATLMVANILFLLSCVTVIGAGGGLIALNHIVCAILLGKRVSVVQDFFFVLKKNIRIGLIITFTLLPVFVWSLYMSLSAYGNYVENGTYLIQFFLYCALFILTNCFAMYFVPLLVCVKADLYTIMITALKLCVLGTWRTILGGLGVSLITVLILLSLPKTIPLFFFVHFSFSVFHCAFCAWKIIDMYVLTPFDENQGQPAEDHRG